MAGQKKGKRARTARTRAAAGNIAQQIWLAGLGALARAQAEGPKVFESLVVEGAAIQERGSKATERAVKGVVANVRGAIDTRAEAVRGRATEALDNIERMFQTRVHKALQQIGVPTTNEIQHLSRKVTELTKSVQALTRSGKTPRARTATSRRATAQSQSAGSQSAPV
jgi:poly(hydroxyalkanoate) granule-associated protein